jgi:hypothetical protein
VRIWLLDDEKPLWSDTIPWPGKQEAKLLMDKPNASSASPLPPSDVSGTPAAKMPTGGQTPAAGTSTTEPKGPAQPSGTTTSTTNIVPPGNVSPNAAGPTPNGPAVTQPANRPPITQPPAWPANPPPAANVNPQPPRPQQPVDIKKMSVDQLVDHIEKNWQFQMAPRDRRKWQGGIFYYYKTQNPSADRLSIFMNIVRDCYWNQPPGELRDAFLVLYVKLKQQQPSAGGRK